MDNFWILFAFILGVNLLAYLKIYPAVAGKDLRRLALADLVLFVVIMLVVASQYAGTQVRFNFGLFTASWWVATLIIHFSLDLILSAWYIKRHRIDIRQLERKKSDDDS